MKKKIDVAIAFFKFLKAARNRVKEGMGKEQILAFAKQEFGEVTKLLRKQIDDLFKAKPKTTKKGDVVPIKKEGIMATDEAAEVVKKRTDDIAMGDPTGEVSEIMEGLGSLKNIKQGGKGLNPREGVVRAAAREILNKNKIKIGKEDPIDLLRKTYGEDALEAVDAIGDDLLNTQTYGEMNDLLTQNKLFNLKAKKVPGYDKSVQDAEELRMLDEFDPKDRDPNAYGGIAGNLRLNRTGFKVGSGVKIYNLVTKYGPEFKKFADMLFIKASNMIRQGKGMWKGLDQKQMMQQHDNLTQKVNTFQKEGTLEGMDQYFGIDAEKAFVEAQAKIKQKSTAGEIKKGVADVMKDTSEAGLARSIEIDNLKLEFPGISDEMIENILTDTNPQRIAEVKATMNEALEMQGKGKGPDEIIDIFTKTPRTRHASGGRVKMSKGGLPNILKL